MHGSWGQKAGNSVRFRWFHPDPAQELFPKTFGGAGGQNRAMELSAGVGQCCRHGMKAIKPVFRAFASSGRRPMGRGTMAPPSWLGAVFSGGFLAAHGRLIEKQGRGTSGSAKKGRIPPFFQYQRP